MKKVNSRLMGKFWEEKGCICPIVPNLQGIRMINWNCPLHKNFTNCIVCSNSNNRVYWGDPNLFGEPSEQINIISNVLKENNEF